MTTLTQAQELLRKWREAAFAATGFEHTSWSLNIYDVLYERPPYSVTLTWWDQEPKSYHFACDDPLTAVRAAIKQSPWPSVGESDGPMPLFTTEIEEQLRAQLAERDARIAKLERELHAANEECNAWLDSSGLVTSAGDPDGITPDAARKFWEGVEADRDAVLAKFRGLREEYEKIAGWDTASLPERVRRQTVLDRFPDEPSEGGR